MKVKGLELNKGQTNFWRIHSYLKLGYEVKLDGVATL